MSRFTDKIVVITGGTSGIGLAAARRFIKEGTQKEFGAMSSDIASYFWFWQSLE